VGGFPKPAVGVFTTPGTRQGRLRHHFVIGYAPLTEPVCRQVQQQSGSGEGGLGRARHGPGAGQRPDGGDGDQGVMVTGRWEPRWEPHG